MTTTIFYQIRTLKHQIEATLKLISDGIRFYIDQLIILEGKLEKLEAEAKGLDQPKVVRLLNILTGKKTWAITAFGGVYATYKSQKSADKALKNTPPWFMEFWGGSVSGSVEKCWLTGDIVIIEAY